MNSAARARCGLSRGFVVATTILLWGGAGCHHDAPPPTQAEQREVTPLVKRGSTQARDAATMKDAPLAAVPPDAPQPDGLHRPGAMASTMRDYAQSLQHLHAPALAAVNTPPSAVDFGTTHLTPQAQLDRAPDAATAPVARPAAPNASVAMPASHRQPGSDSGTAEVVQTTSAAPTPLPARAAVDDLAKFDSRAREYPGDISAQIDDQLARVLHDAPVGESQALAGLLPEDRELLGALLDSLVNFRSQLRADNNILFSQKIRPLVELADRLRAQAELTVPTVALCTSVKAFGVYDPIDPARFIAGRELRFVVYCEVENFTSQLNEKSLYETRLAQDVVLYNENTGQPIWNDKRSVYIDAVRRRRHDFFVGKIISLPPTLPIGRYVLKVTVEDQLAHHVAENTVPVEVVAQLNWDK